MTSLPSDYMHVKMSYHLIMCMPIASLVLKCIWSLEKDFQKEPSLK